jgi:hypothetical protein
MPQRTSAKAPKGAIAVSDLLERFSIDARDKAMIKLLERSPDALPPSSRVFSSFFAAPLDGNWRLPEPRHVRSWERTVGVRTGERR